MIHSILNHKNSDEDNKTSTIFENLLLLSDTLFWKILKESTKNNNDYLPDEAGELEKYEFWPKWNPEGTQNSNYVEPDIFFKFNKIDVIVENKLYEDLGQDPEQWKREFITYLNSVECQARNKPVVLLAVGGNANFKKEQPLVIKGYTCNILKCKWIDLLESVIKIKEEFNPTNQEKLVSSSRIFDNIMEAFHIMGVYEYKKVNSDLEIIYQDFMTLKSMFDKATNRKEKDYQIEKGTSQDLGYVYKVNFSVKLNNNSISYQLGLGIWQQGGLSIILDPANALIKPICETLKKLDISTKKYLGKLCEPAHQDPIYYQYPSQLFYDDFKNANTFDEQLNILNTFIHELISII